MSGLNRDLVNSTLFNDSNEKIILNVNDIEFKVNDLDVVKLTATASAVNYFTMNASATGAALELSAVGTDTNVDINLVPKGAGEFKVGGVAAMLVGGNVSDLTNDSGFLTTTTGDARYYTQTQVDALTWDASDIVSGTFDSARISEASVTQHQAALSITESQISDLGSYITGVAWGDVTGTLANQTDLQNALDAKASSSHDHSGTYLEDLTGSSIKDLSDVYSSMAPTDGQFLVWDNGNTRWTAGDAAASDFVTDSGQVTDATETTIETIAVPTGDERVYTVVVRYNETATGDSGFKRLVFMAKNIAGTASIVGGSSAVEVVQSYDSGAATWVVSAVASAGNILIKFTGEAAHTIDINTSYLAQ